MNPEELEALMALLAQQQDNGLSLAANQYGQGPGFMGLDEQPESWDRVGEKNDLLYDMTRTTGIDFGELVPGLHPGVMRPTADQLTPYVSDQTSLYANNPVYQDILAQVQSGVSLNEALAAAQTDAAQNPEEYEGYIPTSQSFGVGGVNIPGQLDWQSVRQDLETYIPEVQREQRSMDEAAALQQQYEDYIRPRSQWEMNGSQTWRDVRDQADAFMNFDEPTLSYSDVPIDRAALRQGTAEPVSASRSVTEGLGEARNWIGDMIGGSETKSGGQRLQDMGRRTAERASEPSMGEAGPLAVWDRIRQGVANTNRFRESKPRVNLSWQEGAAKQGYEQGMKKAQNIPVASKKEENMARLIAAYNTFHYGEAPPAPAARPPQRALRFYGQ